MTKIYETTYRIYFHLKKFPEALLIAQKMNNQNLIDETMNSCDDEITLKQLCLMLGRQRSNWQTDRDELQRIISYENFNEHFMSLARELDVVNPKAPEQVFKSHLEEKKPDESKLDSHKVNLSVTYANCFINAGFGNDTIMTKEGEELEWIFKNKDYGQIAATASLGLLLLWNIDQGFEKIDKFMDHNNDFIKAGSYLAVGLVNSGIRNQNDPVFALLGDKLESKTQHERLGALMGLSLTYAGSNR